MTAAGADRPRGRLSRTQWILVAMALGVAAGTVFPAAEYPRMASLASATSAIFLRMVTSLIVPLLFSTLVVGIAGQGDDLKRVGRLAVRTIVYYAAVSLAALAIGLAVVNLLKPGAGVSLAGADPAAATGLAAQAITVRSVVEHAVPQSFFDAAARNEMLQVVFFAIIFAAGLARVQGRPRVVMVEFCEALAEVMFKFVDIVMAFAPIGIGAALAVTVSNGGLATLGGLAKLALTLYLAIVVYVLVVMIPVARAARIPVRVFWRHLREPWLVAFSATSSEAALPVAMQNLERFGVPKRIVSFVMPAGYSFNLDGSTLYLAVASVFAAQAAGIEMSLDRQLIMMLTLMLASKGVAAVPRASLVILAGALATFGLPVEAVALILGVDAIMDMGRTSVNLLGNSLAAAVMARWEGASGATAGESAAVNQ